MREIIEREFERIDLREWYRVALDTSAAIAILSGQAGGLLSRSIEQFFLPAPVVGVWRQSFSLS